MHFVWRGFDEVVGTQSTEQVKVGQKLEKSLGLAS